MAVHADFSIAKQVVQQDELAGDLMVVGSYLFTEDGEPRIAVALAEVAQHLVVGAILLDDVEDMLDGRTDAYLARNDAWRRWFLRGCQLLIAIRGVVVNLLGPGTQVGLQLGEVYDLDAPLLQALHRAIAFRPGREGTAGTTNIGV